MEPHADDRPDRGAFVWEMEGRAAPVGPPSRPTGFRDALRLALRVGHGGGSTFTFALRSGGKARLRLSGVTPFDARWLRTGLLEAYPEGCWVKAQNAGPTTFTVSVAWGRRVRRWPDPFRTPDDVTPALDALVAAAAHAPVGFELEWQFAPAPAIWSSSGGARPEALAGGVSRVDPKIGPRRAGPAVGRDSGPPEALALRPLFWRSTARILTSAAPPPRGKVERFLRLAEASLRSSAGNGIRFFPNRLFRWGYRPWFAVSEEELVGTLPSPEAGAGTMVGPRATGIPQLPLGRNPRGDVVGPPVEALEGRHLAILGETGMGKSSTLIAVAHRAARLGGVILFDPVGETARQFLAGLPASDAARTLRISPSEVRSGINALEGISRDHAGSNVSDRRLGDLVHALRRVRAGRYVSNHFWGPRLEEMLVRALRAAAAYPLGTLSDAHRLLESGRWDPARVPEEARETLTDLVDRIRSRPEDAEGARRLLYEVVSNPVLEQLLCDRSPTLHVRTLVQPRRIAVISGDAASVGELTARYLLSVYLALVWSELLARPGVPKTFVVLDEAQWFSHETLAEMLRLARRRNVHVILATQAVASLPEEVRESLWTNTSDFLVFRGSPEEAREIARTAPSVPMDELLALPRGRAIALLGKGGEVRRIRTAGRSTTHPAPEDAGRSPSPPLKPDPTILSTAPPTGEVLAWLRSRSVPGDGTGLVTVNLSEIRESVDPTGDGVRAAGAVLGRAGALVGRRKSREGAQWTIDLGRLASIRELPEPGDGTGATEGPQHS